MISVRTASTLRAMNKELVSSTMVLMTPMVMLRCCWDAMNSSGFIARWIMKMMKYAPKMTMSPSTMTHM